MPKPGHLSLPSLNISGNKWLTGAITPVTDDFTVKSVRHDTSIPVYPACCFCCDDVRHCVGGRFRA
jgi:hypothetical protein